MFYTVVDMIVELDSSVSHVCSCRRLDVCCTCCTLQGCRVGFSSWHIFAVKVEKAVVKIVVSMVM